MSNPNPLPPGFRFHPTDEELVLHYLQKRAASLPCPVSIIAEVDIYKFDPWDLPDKTTFGDREWYFFTPRDRKYPNGVRPNRAARSGYWKATGTDKPIKASKGGKTIGIKKALVFYKGRPPKGLKTNWIMHEYRLAEAETSNNYRPMKFRNNSMRLDDWVLCRIYNKGNNIQAIPPLMEGDQEESGIDDFDTSNFLNFETRNNIPKLQKTNSLSDFLEDYSSFSNLFDSVPEIPGPQHNGFMVHQPSLNQILSNNNSNIGAHATNNSVQYHQQPISCTTTSIAENSMKRQRLNDSSLDNEEGFLLQSSKKLNHANVQLNFSNQFDLQQGNLVNQSYFNQQLLLNPQLGLQ